MWKRRPTALEKSFSAESPTPTPPGLISTQTCPHPPNPLSRLCPAVLGAPVWFPQALGANGRAGSPASPRATPGVSAPGTQHRRPLLQTPSGSSYLAARRCSCEGPRPHRARQRDGSLVGRLSPKNCFAGRCWPQAPPAPFSLWFPTREPLRGCVFASTPINPPLSVMLGRCTAAGVSFERVPPWAAGDTGKSLAGGPQGGCGVPREGCGVPRVPPALGVTSPGRQSLLPAKPPQPMLAGLVL